MSTPPAGEAPARLWHCYGCGYEADLGAMGRLVMCPECDEGTMTLQAPEPPPPAAAEQPVRGDGVRVLSRREFQELAKELRDRAVRCEPGTWKLWGGDVMADPKGTSDVDDAVLVARCPLQPNELGGSHVSNAYYIQAAQPQNVLRLLATIEALMEDDHE